MYCIAACLIEQFSCFTCCTAANISSVLVFSRSITLLYFRAITLWINTVSTMLDVLADWKCKQQRRKKSVRTDWSNYLYIYNFEYCPNKWHEYDKCSQKIKGVECLHIPSNNVARVETSRSSLSVKCIVITRYTAHAMMWVLSQKTLPWCPDAMRCDKKIYCAHLLTQRDTIWCDVLLNNYI